MKMYQAGFSFFYTLNGKGVEEVVEEGAILVYKAILNIQKSNLDSHWSSIFLAGSSFMYM